MQQRRCMRERTAAAAAYARVISMRLMDVSGRHFLNLTYEKSPFRGFGSEASLAEPEGFEPSMQVLPTYSLSRGAPSATRSQLRRRTGSHSNREDTPLRRP